MAKKKREDKVAKFHGKSVEEVLKMLQKKHGATSIMRMDEHPMVQKVDVISTGSLWVDSALGIGGLPRGRITELFGTEGGGKTTLAVHCVAEAQKKGGYALYIDAEHALDMRMAKKIGVDTSRLMLCQPDSGEQAMDILETAIISGKFDIAVVDSVSALTPQAEIDGNVGDSFVGLHARMLGQAMRKINAATSRTNTLVIFINQIRMKIGVMFGNPETTSGGQALKFFASIRMDIRRIGALKVGEKTVGNKVQVKIVKNKLAPPYKVITTDLIFGSGFSKESELLQIADDLDVVDIVGKKYNYEGKLIGDSKLNAIKNLKSDRKLFKSIFKSVRLAKSGKKSLEEGKTSEG
jgi:recombination protein RecA